MSADTVLLLTGWAAVALAASAWLSRLLVSGRHRRISPDTAPTGMTWRTCDSETCMDRMPHLVLPCGAALCAGCGHENPVTARSRRTP